MTRPARGEIRIDVWQVFLDIVENAWQRDQHEMFRLSSESPEAIIWPEMVVYLAEHFVPLNRSVTHGVRCRIGG
jgi:hypothetical protein